MSVEYKESVKKAKWGYKELVRRYDNGDIEELCTRYDRRHKCDKVISRTVRHPDGSEEAYDEQNNLEHQVLTDGTVLGYQNGLLHSKYLPDGSMQNFHDNGKISLYKNADRSLFIHYDEDENIIKKDDYKERRFIGYAPSGEIKFDFSPQRAYINYKYYPLYKLGQKSLQHENHWVEGTTLDPHKKTILCFGGNITYRPEDANGYLNAVIEMFNFSPQQAEQIQLVSCYRPRYPDLEMFPRDAENNYDFSEAAYQARKSEVLLKLMPFMAVHRDGAWERLPVSELYANFRNLMLVSHCGGANDLPIIAEILHQTMDKLGYDKTVQQRALKQIVCLTNNNNREFTDNNGFTTFHRYSVYDGQYVKAYEGNYSADYPVFLEKYLPYRKFRGNKAAFVTLRKNELLMVFDKVLKDGGEEHMNAFFCNDMPLMTAVGRMQAAIFRHLGKFWLESSAPIKTAAEFLQQSVQSVKLRQKISAAFITGRKLQRCKVNPLENTAILSSNYNKHKNNNFPPEKNGVWKILSKQAQESTPQEKCAEVYRYLLHHLRGRN